ncbi:tyrosine-type recombinase/integrase [Desulfobulbus propionicus]
MRPSEAAGLRWDQIDFERRALTLLITKNEPRTVPLTKTVLEVLAKLKNSNWAMHLTQPRTICCGRSSCCFARILRWHDGIYQGLP